MTNSIGTQTEDKENRFAKNQKINNYIILNDSKNGLEKKLNRTLADSDLSQSIRESDFDSSNKSFFDKKMIDSRYFII